MTATFSAADYALQLARIAQGLAVAHNEAARDDLQAGDRFDMVEYFTQGNLEKRCEKLADQLELLDDAFDDLNVLIDEYVRTIPLAAYDTGSSDTDRFAGWLSRRMPLDAEQRDLLTVIRSRYQVEELGRQHRMDHVRFQELCSVAAALASDLDVNPELVLHLNPIRLWATFESDLFGTGDADCDDPDCGGCRQDRPADHDILFFASGNEIRTVTFDDFGCAVLKALSDRGPCPLSDLESRLQHAGIEVDRDLLLQTITDCGELRLIAFS